MRICEKIYRYSDSDQELEVYYLELERLIRNKDSLYVICLYIVCSIYIEYRCICIRI